MMALQEMQSSVTLSHIWIMYFLYKTEDKKVKYLKKKQYAF